MSNNNIFLNLLNKHKTSIANSKVERNDKDEEILFNEYYSKNKDSNEHPQNITDSYKLIPKFFYQMPTEDDILLLKLREEARSLYLQKRTKELLENEELQSLWTVLEKYQTVSHNKINDQMMINYANFKKASMEVIPKCRPFFKASIYAKFLNDDTHGRIYTIHFFNYVMRKIWMYQTRIGLSLYDAYGLGFLREIDLDSYILELIPTLPLLEKLEKSVYSFYVCTVSRKFFFFLDPMRTGKIKIQDILSSSFLDDLLELREENQSEEAQENNWFSPLSAMRIYGQYLNLDVNHNGMLNKEELSKYGSGSLTSAFLDRVFQVCQTYEGEMDFKNYLDFVLALENKKTPQSIQYIFRCLDVQHKGYLNNYDINYFHRSIHDRLISASQDAISFEDLKNEIFDMSRTENPNKITLQDLLKCGQGETVVGILIDMASLWSYETRECVPENIE